MSPLVIIYLIKMIQKSWKCIYQTKKNTIFAIVWKSDLVSYSIDGVIDIKTNLVKCLLHILA